MGQQVLAVIGARLNSSRLPKKQLRPLFGEPVISHIVRRLQAVPHITGIVIATTDETFNDELREWAESAGVDCFSYSGDIDDVVGRVDAVVRDYDPDLLVYICGDCPLIEPVTLDGMIKELLAHPGAEFVTLTPAPDGGRYIHEGFDVYRRSFWDKIAQASTEAYEKEHLASAYHHSGKVDPTGICYFAEDPLYATVTHRISIDTYSDLQFMQAVYDAWYESHSSDTIVSLSWVISMLQKGRWHDINAHVHQKHVGEEPPSVCFVVEAGQGIGLGHLARMIVLARAFQDCYSASLEFLVKCDALPELDFQGVPVARISDGTDVRGLLLSKLQGADILVQDLKGANFDFADREKDADSDCFIVSIDNPDIGLEPDFLMMPSFVNGRPDFQPSSFGWNHFLLRRVVRRPDTVSEVKRVIVLSGAGLAGERAKQLASGLMSGLPRSVTVSWVIWPGTADPLEGLGHQNWKPVEASPNLAGELASYDAAVAAYGVSFFECLNAGLPTVVYDALGTVSDGEWRALEEAGVAMPVDDLEEIGPVLSKLISDSALRQHLIKTATGKLTNDGGREAVTSIMKAYLKKRET
ncbi:cytidylyltransferase domain-containing protein [Kordiimonas lipolytica]|uniref:Cytidylyltransferase domain-containing protein n=1 Tax=Kordiimonas lipolytica TaxID=1662421 RepID=A0ABV8UFL0_9PROT|nr:NTP transferase domain-containing protein [Kordiimonas lipolytica]